MARKWCSVGSKRTEPFGSKHQNSPSNADWTVLLSVPVRPEPGPEATDDGFVRLIIRQDGDGNDNRLSSVLVVRKTAGPS